MGGWSKDAEGNIIETLTWRKIKNRWWTFGADGYLKTGWVKDNVTGNWYMNDENAGNAGGMVSGSAQRQLVLSGTGYRNHAYRLAFHQWKMVLSV